MKTESKNLLIEMINYLSNNKENLNYLKKVDEEAEKNEDNDCYNQIRDITEWLDLHIVKLLKKNEEKLYLKSDNEILNIEKYIDNMKFLFLNCPRLKDLLILKDNDIIYFNSNISKKEQKEIRQFVSDNRIRKVVNFYKPAYKTKEE